VIAIRSYNAFLGNRMVQFGIPDYPVFLTRGLSILLVADVSIMVVSYIVASMTKTLSRS
jgi:hypothetical protein